MVLRIVLAATAMLWVQAALAQERPTTAPAPEGYVPYVPTESDQIQLATGPIAERLREQYADRMAGLYFESAETRIVVRLTGTEEVEPEEHHVGNSTLRVLFEPGAQHTFAELNTIMDREREKIEQLLPTAHARYVDERTGELVVAVEPDDDEGLSAGDRLSEALSVPVRIEAEEPAIPN